MIKSLRIGGASLIALALALSPAQANFTFQNATTSVITEFSFDSASTPIAGTGNCATYECVADVPIDKTGTPLFSSSNPGLVGGLGTAGSPSGGVVSIQGVTSGQAVPVSGTFWQTTQPVSGTFWQTTQPVSGTFWQTTQPVSGTVTAAQATAGSLNATVVGTGTFATQLTGSTNNINNISGTISLPTGAATAANQTSIQGVIGNATAPTDMSVGGLVYNSTPLTLTNGQSSAFQGDASGYLNVHIQAGGGSGGTAAADNAAWTAGTTQQTPAGCEYTSGGATALTTAHAGTLGCTSARGLFTDKSSVGGTALVAAVSAYGTAPTGTEVEGVNAYVTNSLTALVNNADSVAPISSVTATAGNSPVNASMYSFDGTNFDRVRGTSGGHLIFEGAGTAGSASGGVATVQGVASMTPFLTQPQAVASGGALNYGPLYSAASTNATNVKSSAGTLYSVTVTQSTTTPMELKLYNTSSSPTCSSATGIIDNIPIPSNATSPGFHLPYPVGRAFSTGISFCLVAFGNPASSTDSSNAATGATVSMTYD